MFAILIAFLVFIFFMIMGAPIFVGIFVGAGVGLYVVQGTNAVLAFFSQSLHDLLAQYIFAVIPMFILVGMLSETGGLGTRAYETFYKLFGHLRGGLLIATTFAGAAFGACSGSSVASAALFSKIALPELRKYGYKDSFSMGGIAAAGTLAIMIPPSMGMVVFGVLSNTSIGKLLIGGIIPGIMITIILCLVIYTMVRFNPQLATAAPKSAPLREKLKTPLTIWPIILVFLIIVGSLWSGLVTASESGALGVVVVLAWNFINRVPMKTIVGAFREAAITSGQIMILIIAGLIISKVVAYTGISKEIVDWITVNNLSLPVVWAILIGIWLIMGMFIDPTSQLVLTVPFIFPVMVKLGVDPVALGIVAVLMQEVGLITPPVGFNCYIVASIAGVDPLTAFKGILPFFIVLMAAALILISFPILSTWLPKVAYG